MLEQRVGQGSSKRVEGKGNLKKQKKIVTE